MQKLKIFLVLIALTGSLAAKDEFIFFDHYPYLREGDNFIFSPDSFKNLLFDTQDFYYLKLQLSSARNFIQLSEVKNELDRELYKGLKKKVWKSRLAAGVTGTVFGILAGSVLVLVLRK